MTVRRQSRSARTEFTSVMRMNSIHWLTSLGPDELGVTRRVLEDLAPLCVVQGVALETAAPATAVELFAALDGIAASARGGMLPLVHLDMHGSAEDGLLLSPSGERAAWQDVADRLRAINEATGNNLCVVSGACFSFNVVRELDINRTAPFYILLAPEDLITAGDLEERTVGFYRDMLEGTDVLASNVRWFGSLLRVFHAEKMLAVVLSKYLNNAAVGRQRERRVEHLVTLAVDGGIPPNRHNLRTLRRNAAKMITPTEELIERFMPTFLAGKRPGFTVAQLKKMVVQARADGMTPDGPYS